MPVDCIEEAVLDKNKEAVKADVDKAMRKIQSKVRVCAEASRELADLLKKSGRDWMVYAPFASWWHEGMLGLLSKWDESWKLEDSAGLLMDISLHFNKFAKAGKERALLMNSVMEESRTPQQVINKNSQWAKDLPEGTKTQSGVSASTASVLILLERLGIDAPQEIEAIVNSLIYYWKDSWIKQFTKQYHTAAEVWAVYTSYLLKHTKSPPPPPSPPKLKAKL
ncbi:MAG: hypothetical protein JWO09_774 [Bacteroidetes bacterium]|nr:hypothetical protein [Bacteroidota bacterium]